MILYREVYENGKMTGYFADAQDFQKKQRNTDVFRAFLTQKSHISAEIYIVVLSFKTDLNAVKNMYKDSSGK